MAARPEVFLREIDKKGHMKERCGSSEDIPRKGGRRSISTFSETTKRLLLCFLGGLPTIGMVSFGPERRRLRVPARGGVAEPSRPPRDVLSIPSYEPERTLGSGAESGLVTTMGGAGVVLSL